MYCAILYLLYCTVLCCTVLYLLCCAVLAVLCCAVLYLLCCAVLYKQRKAASRNRRGLEIYFDVLPAIKTSQMFASATIFVLCAKKIWYFVVPTSARNVFRQRTLFLAH